MADNGAEHPLSIDTFINPGALIGLHAKSPLRIEDGVASLESDWGAVEFAPDTGRVQQIRLNLETGSATATFGEGTLSRLASELETQSADWPHHTSDRSFGGEFLHMLAESSLPVLEEENLLASELLKLILNDEFLNSFVRARRRPLNIPQPFPPDLQAGNPGSRWLLKFIRTMFPEGSGAHRVAAAFHRALDGYDAPTQVLLHEIGTSDRHGPITCLVAAAVLTGQRRELAKVGLKRLHLGRAELQLILSEPCGARPLLARAIESIQTAPDDSFRFMLQFTDDLELGLGYGAQLRALVHALRRATQDDGPFETVWDEYGEHLARACFEAWLPTEDPNEGLNISIDTTGRFVLASDEWSAEDSDDERQREDERPRSRNTIEEAGREFSLDLTPPNPNGSYCRGFRKKNN